LLCARDATGKFLPRRACKARKTGAFRAGPRLAATEPETKAFGNVMKINPAPVFIMNHDRGPASTRTNAPGNAPVNAPSNTGSTKQGTVSSSQNGDGTFSTTMSKVNGQKTIDKTVNYADGTSKTSERTVTVNADGSKTVTKTGANGKTSTIQESMVKNADGTFSLSEEITKANGKVTDVSGTVTKSDGETDKALAYTNAQGEAKTIDTQSTHTGNIVMRSVTGTGYGGNTIDNTSTWQTFA
jgi:hypothetical protein